MSLADSPDQLARKICQKMHANDPVCQTLNISLEEVRSGFARISMHLDENMLNAYGTGHGGYSFLLADTAFGLACNSRGEKAFGQSAHITYLTFGQPGELLTAVAEARSHANRTGIFDVTVLGEDGRAVAEFRGLSRKVGDQENSQGVVTSARGAE